MSAAVAVVGGFIDTRSGVAITKGRALQELRRHGCDAASIRAFIEDCGDRAFYAAVQVLRWLGY